MRELKFRAWDGDKMITEPAFIQILGLNDFLVFREDIPAWVADNVTLMQYIGVKDKVGNEIYEDDIISYISNGVLQYRQVFWDNETVAFLTKNIHFKDDLLLGFGWLSTNGIFKVVGNTYEHPILFSNPDSTSVSIQQPN